MLIDKNALYRFEEKLDPKNLEASEVSAEIIDFGEISVIFRLKSQPDIVYKRMPIFDTRTAAEKYSIMYHDYCRYLTAAGLTLPESETCIIEVPDRPVVLFIAQQKLPEDRLCHKLIHILDTGKCREMIGHVISETNKVWEFNKVSGPSVELAIDGQLSNWAFVETENDSMFYYIDTSTPLFRLNEKEQQNPELMLQSAPGFLRWIIRLFFLDDVMNRYYVPKLVYTDLAANLFKEQKPELIPDAISIINTYLPDKKDVVVAGEVEKYYKEDKLIWSLFLAFRKVDRWLKTALFRGRYEFILPGKIKR
ncbi:MAG: hypothetical protein JRI91_02430 [Deltaproteobacteria bacterium]|nr:hypothetical protein [Deltaproteobacteria bacterium]